MMTAMGDEFLGAGPKSREEEEEKDGSFLIASTAVSI